jgi:hypothetical protein
MWIMGTMREKFYMVIMGSREQEEQMMNGHAEHVELGEHGIKKTCDTST